MKMKSGASWPWASNPRLGLIGNPENRRVRDFQDTAVALGFSSPPCLSYEELLQDPGALARFDVDLIRIESPGENERVARCLIALGGGPRDARLAFGEIAFQREYHAGFCHVLKWIEQRRIPCLNAPADIALMFDKWRCHQLFQHHHVARPPAELAPPDFAALAERMRADGSGRLFLKPLHGSSGSGVCALRWTPRHQQLTAPLRFDSDAGRSVLVNSLKVRTYTRFADLEGILNRLLPDGMIGEQWIPKLTLPEGAVDLRVLVIAGEARHWVVRQSSHPMTNLHLGNRRADESALLDCIGRDGLNAAFALAEQAVRCFPNSLYAGVDILIDARHRVYVGEINAFGDLLPRLVHRNESAYAAIANACHDRGCLV